MNEIFSTTRLKFAEMYQDSVTFLEKTYGTVGNYFTNASPFGQLLRVSLNLARLIFYYIEDSITELNIFTATRNNSVRGLAQLVGHNVTRPIAASGDLKFTYNGKPVNMYGNSVILPNHTELKNGVNGLKYTMFLSGDSVSLELNARNSIDVRVQQGSMEVQVFTGTGEKLQSFNAATRGGKNIDHHEVTVFVNNQKFKIYKSLFDIPKDANGCLVRTSQGEGIDIFFGNSYNGAIPATGSEIRIEYLTTQGQEGNINTTDTDMQWEFIDSGFDLSGEEVDLNDIINVSISKLISFGSSFEPIFLTRIIAPRTSRSYVLANPDNYIVFLEKFNYFSIIDAFNTFDDEYLDDDNVIYLFLIPDVNKRISGNDNYFTIDKSYFTLTKDEKDKIYILIEESGQKMVTAVNTIIDPIIKKYILNISLVVFEGFSRSFIKQQIISKMSEYFISFRRRDRVPKSDLIRVIENIEGVDSVNLWFTSQENEANKKSNPDAEAVGLDEFGDIIIGRGELPLIRGGWEDRNEVVYEDSTNDEKPSSINISVKKVIPKNYNSEVHRINVDKIR